MHRISFKLKLFLFFAILILFVIGSTYIYSTTSKVENLLRDNSKDQETKGKRALLKRPIIPVI